MTATALKDRYGPVVARCSSKLRPGVYYEVRQHPTTQALSCNCRGWATSAKRPGGRSCKHTQALEQSTATGQSVVDFDRAGQMVATTPRQQMRRDGDPVDALVSSRRRDRFSDEPIRSAAFATASLLAERGYLRPGLPVRDVVVIIDVAIRQFAGTASVNADAAPSSVVSTTILTGGVREIVLDD